MQGVEKEHAGFAWTGRHAALLPIEQQIWTMTEADIVEAIILDLEFAGDVYEIHGLRLLRMMSTTRMIKQMIPTNEVFDQRLNVHYHASNHSRKVYSVLTA
jgi:hypothetical protein